MSTLKQFCEHSNIDAALIRAVVRQFGGWDSFCESAQDVANHGIDGGFHGFIYYADTLKFARTNKAIIMAMAKQQADEFGQSVMEMIAGFNCLKMAPDELAEALYNTHSENRTQVLNALAWYAGEEVCRSYVDWQYENKLDAMINSLAPDF